MNSLTRKLLLLAAICGTLSASPPPSPIQAPPAVQAPQTITILRKAWIGPYRIRGRTIPVQELAPGIYFERPPVVPRWLDPLGVFAR